MEPRQALCFPLLGTSCYSLLHLDSAFLILHLQAKRKPKQLDVSWCKCSFTLSWLLGPSLQNCLCRNHRVKTSEIIYFGILISIMLTQTSEAWENSWVVKRVYNSSRGPKLGSQDPCQAAHKHLWLKPHETQFSFLDSGLWTHTHTHEHV